MSDANNDEERAAGEASASVSVSNNGEIDLLDTTTIPTAEAEEGTTDIRVDENEDDEFHDTQASLPKEEEVKTDFSIEAVTKLVNEVRGVDATESPLLSQKIEAMEQGSSRPFYRDDPSSRSSAEACSDDDYDYYSTSIPPAGIWSTTSTQRPQLQSTRRRRFNYVRSCLRSKYSMYCVIVTTLIAIGVGISAAITKGFEYSEHRNELLHPKWENDGIVQDDQEQQQQQLDEETDITTLPKNDLSENNNEGSIMQSDISSTSSPLPEQVYTDSQQTLSYQIANTYIPIWFDRESGWNGSTHAEAMEFCNSVDDTSSLVFAPCPYHVYCPGGGDGATVLFDEGVDEADSWAPVLETNMWVQVGSGERVCESVFFMDDLREELTRHIMCCLEHPLELGGGVILNSSEELQEPTTGGEVNVPPNVKDENGDDNVEDPIPPPPPPPMSSSSSISTNNVDETSSEMDMPPVENELFVEYRPAWFRYEQGWSGTTYEDGKLFCESVKDGPTSLDALQLCPLEVYCPKGPGYDKPLFYEMDAYEGEQWAPVSDGSDRWVMLGDEGYLTCDMNPPDVSVGTLSPVVKKYILCCKVPAQGPTDIRGDNSLPEGGIEHVDSQPPPTSSSVPMSNPVWFSDDKGWSGTTFEDGKQFCESMKVGPNPDDTFHLCPLEVYCPKGEVDDKPLYYEMDAFEGEQWAPVSDSNDLWVMLGDEGYQTCAVNQPTVPVGAFPPKFKRYILCCQDNPEMTSSSNVVGDNSAEVPEVDLEHFDFEDAVSGKLNPVWYGTDEWISGSYEDASHFCNFKGKSLCPYAAYCPYGPGMPPVDGWVPSKEFEEQWAPTATTNNWVLIGAENDDPFSQCKVTESPSFGFDKSQSELKLHIMCCDELHSEAENSNAGNSEVNTQEAINSEASSSSSATFESFGPPPVWYHSTDGWNGGGHEAAILFCLSKEKTLCPVEVICPNGPKKSLISSFGGDVEPEQWAPASDKENYWIMIGAYNNDDTTICQDQDDILGGYPSWGLDDSYSQHKRHILCCSPT